MDGTRFDSLTRRLAAGTSRRGVLRGAVGVALGGLLGAPLAAQRAEAAVGRPASSTCRKSSECMAGTSCVAGAAGRSYCTCDGPNKACNGVCIPNTNCCTSKDCPKEKTCLSGACISIVGGPCASNADCISGLTCVSGTCRSPLSAACQSDSNCVSNQCVDGVCCDAPCTGQCEACNLANALGTCYPIPNGGLPVTGTSVGRSSCGSDGGTCGGACDGGNRTACAYPDDSVSCRAESCVDGVTTQSAVCDGAGSCPDAVVEACASDGSVCAGVCASANQAVCSYPGSSVSCRSTSCAGGVVTQAAVCDGEGVCPDLVTVSCPAPQNGTATCAANGIDCAFTCNSGYKVCGSSCIPLTSCCDGSDCNGGSCANGLCVCGGTTCPAAKVCGPTGACTNGCFIRDQTNPNGKFWRKGDYNADWSKPCKICQPQQSLNSWVNSPAGNPCGNDCSKACNGDGTCGTGPAANVNPTDLTTNPGLCIFSCEMTDPQTGQVVPCCHNCDTYANDDSLLGYCASGMCVGPVGRFRP